MLGHIQCFKQQKYTRLTYIRVVAVVLLVPDDAVVSTYNDIDAIYNYNIIKMKAKILICTCGCGVTGLH